AKRRGKVCVRACVRAREVASSGNATTHGVWGKKKGVDEVGGAWEESREAYVHSQTGGCMQPGSGSGSGVGRPGGMNGPFQHPYTLCYPTVNTLFCLSGEHVRKDPCCPARPDDLRQDPGHITRYISLEKQIDDGVVVMEVVKRESAKTKQKLSRLVQTCYSIPTPTSQGLKKLVPGVGKKKKKKNKKKKRLCSGLLFSPDYYDFFLTCHIIYHSIVLGPLACLRTDGPVTFGGSQSPYRKQPSSPAGRSGRKRALAGGGEGGEEHDPGELI
ncbi:hypothetical protein L249_5816, partial [Ophiocordyceps polyrhachis-furcata BCC 54312]